MSSVTTVDGGSSDRARVAPDTEVEKVTGTSTLATVSLSASSARLAQKGATVQVTLPDGGKASGEIIKVATVVLTVPVRALVALAKGGYGVQVVENGTTRVVAVETGLFADGKVEIKGTGVQAGMTVVVSS